MGTVRLGEQRAPVRPAMGTLHSQANGVEEGPPALSPDWMCRPGALGHGTLVRLLVLVLIPLRVEVNE